MPLSNYLAELWGILFVVIPLALLLNERYLKKLFEASADDKTLFCWGAASLTIGLAVILSHNIWVQDWRVVITIFGWLALLKGLMSLFVPDQIRKTLKKLEHQQWLSFALIVMLFIGLVLTYYGFTAQ